MQLGICGASLTLPRSGHFMNEHEFDLRFNPQIMTGQAEGEFVAHKQKLLGPQ